MFPTTYNPLHRIATINGLTIQEYDRLSKKKMKTVEKFSWLVNTSDLTVSFFEF